MIFITAYLRARLGYEAGCHVHIFVGMLITNEHMTTSEDVRGHSTQLSNKTIIRQG